MAIQEYEQRSILHQNQRYFPTLPHHKSGYLGITEDTTSLHIIIKAGFHMIFITGITKVLPYIFPQMCTKQLSQCLWD